MSILRDERLLALHDLVEACRASAQQTEIAAEVLSEGSLVKQLEALAAQRRRDAEELCEPILESEDIPPALPEERGLLESAVAAAKAAFAADGGAAILEDCREKEQNVLRCAEAAAKAPLLGNEKTRVERLAADARKRLSDLSKP